MKHAKVPHLTLAALILAFGASASRGAHAEDVNMWDGQWHADVEVNGWIPWLYTTAQLPPIAGGGNPTIETQPSDYLKYVKATIQFDGSVRKGDWSLWTDLVYLNLQTSPTHVRVITLPDGEPIGSLTRSLDGDVRAAIWTLAPTYTVMNNDVGTLDVLVGLRYSDFKLSLSYQFTAPALPAPIGGGFWPTTSSTDGIVGLKGSLRLSHDGKWFMPYEADIGDGNKNWQYNLNLGAGYHFHWGDVTLGVRNLTYQTTDRPIIEKVRMTGPVIGAAFRW
jgi:hypothetical protein